MKYIVPVILGLAVVYIISASIFSSPGIKEEKETTVADNKDTDSKVTSIIKETTLMGKANSIEKDWRKELSSEQFCILREKGTEQPFTGKYVDEKRRGIYTCAGCGQKLFSSSTKFKSGSGWPSYFQPVSEEAIMEKEDNSQGMKRTEVLCSKCGGHLGHVFEDGPKPTGLRYCINSVALEFISEENDDNKVVE